MSIVSWMLYAAVVSAVIAARLWSTDRLVRALGVPARWVWLSGLVLSVAIPAVVVIVGTTPASNLDAIVDGANAERLESTETVPAAFRTAAVTLDWAQVLLGKGVVFGAGVLARVSVNDAWVGRA